ncbi:MAG: ATP synthase F0 subunit B [Desulfosarcinaceae bacterium]
MKAWVMNGIKVIPLVVLILWGLGGEALAADGFQFTRAHYDQIMRYVNFLILAFIIVKFGRKPILGFLRGQKNEVVDSIGQLEARKQEAEDRIKQSREQLSHSKDRLAEITARIQVEGQQIKQKLIEQAQSESKMMMAAAQMKIQGYMREAAAKLRFELLDAATQQAVEKMPAVLVSEDHDRLFHQWLDAVEHKLP